MRQHHAKYNNPTAARHNTTQQVKHEAILVQHKATRLQHGYNTSYLYACFIYLYHHFIIVAWHIRLESSVYVVKLRKPKTIFPVKAKIELKNLMAAIFCNCVSVFLFTGITLIVSFFLFELLSRKLLSEYRRYYFNCIFLPI